MKIFIDGEFQDELERFSLKGGHGTYFLTLDGIELNNKTKTVDGLYTPFLTIQKDPPALLFSFRRRNGVLVRGIVVKKAGIKTSLVFTKDFHSVSVLTADTKEME